MRLEFTLPVPPSVNTAYFNRKDGQGRGKGKAVGKYTLECLMALQPVIRANKWRCDQNIIQRMAICRGVNGTKANAVGTIAKAVKDDRPRYRMKYTFFFPNDIPRDIANFEKIMTDIMVEVGLLLDDQFIDDMHLVRGAVDAKNPRVEIVMEQFNRT